MSHWINDVIADQAIDQVAAMSDFDVLHMLFNDFNVGSPISGSIVADPDKAAKFMDSKRDQLVDLVFNQMLDRPGPHG